MQSLKMYALSKKCKLKTICLFKVNSVSKPQQCPFVFFSL